MKSTCCNAPVTAIGKLEMKDEGYQCTSCHNVCTPQEKEKTDMKEILNSIKEIGEVLEFTLTENKELKSQLKDFVQFVCSNYDSINDFELIKAKEDFLNQKQ